MFTFIQKWHKKIGTYIALFVVFLAISGIALNHSEKLKLNTTYIKVDWLLNLYQVNPKSEPIGYLSSNNWVIQVGKRIYFNNKEIINDTNELVGMVKINDTYVIAYDGKLMLLNKEGEKRYFYGRILYKLDKINKKIIIEIKPNNPILPNEIAQGNKNAISKSKIINSIATK